MTPDASRNDHFGQQTGISRVRLVELGAVFLISYLLLFAGMSRLPGMYDEGIVLTGAMRVAAGQVPHRDFYFIYGPAECYLLAGLFKIFGEGLLVERLFDLFFKALILTSVYGIVLRQCRRTIAVFITSVTFLWLFGLSVFGHATTSILLFNLVGSWLILPAFERPVSASRMFTAGAVAGLAALFRYDTGVALLGIQACTIAIAIYPRSTSIGGKLQVFASTFWPYLFGFAVLTIPPAIYYLHVAPLSWLIHDIIEFPSKHYYSARNLPFPGIRLKELENLGVYLPIPIVCLALYALFEAWFHTRVAATGALENTSRRARRGFLVTFSLLLVVMYLKGLVRVSPLQMYLATIPALLLVAVLFQYRAEFPKPVRISISFLLWLSLLPATWLALHQVSRERAFRSSVAQRIFPGGREAAPAIEAAWCETKSALTRGLCFLPEDDRLRAIEFINSHTRPGQTLYSGLNRHDIIFANDNLIYFATQRLPATRWSHFDPDLQTSYEIQHQMVQELRRNAPPYVLLDGEFDLSREPNDSSKSSGVTLLDTFIHENYRPSETFGMISIWQRR